MNKDLVYLTFPTDKKTAKTITEIAHIEGKTQPQLLNEICQAYIQEKLLDIVGYLKTKGINIEELIKE